MGNWTAKDLIGKTLVQVNGGAYEPISRQQVKKEKIQKLPNLLERAQMQAIPDNKIIGEDSKASKNKKVKNAIKSVVDGVKFDSNLEKYMYGLLKGAKINFEFQKVYLLQEGFKYNGEAVRPITSRVDFYVPYKNIIIDTKGWANDVSPLKYKMLKKALVDDWKEKCKRDEMIAFTPPRIEMPKNKKECDLLLNRILFDK